MQMNEQDELKEFGNFFMESDVNEVTDKEIEAEIFAPFYNIFVHTFLNWKAVPYEQLPLNNVEKKMIHILYESIQEIPLRVCIYDMRRLKQQKHTVCA